MINLYVNKAKIGEYDEKNKIITTKKDLINHLYRYLHSFSINYDILVTNDWKELRFVTDLTTFCINKFDFDLFTKKFNNIISFGNERQYTLPLSIMKEIDNETLRVILQPLTIADFMISIDKPNSKYREWVKRYIDWGVK